MCDRQAIQRTVNNAQGDSAYPLEKHSVAVGRKSSSETGGDLGALTFVVEQQVRDRDRPWLTLQRLVRELMMGE